MSRIVFGFLLLFHAMMCPHLLRAQKASCTLNGKLHIKGIESYPYKLTLDISGERVKGQSVTGQDGIELKCKVKGVINKDKKILIITETAAMGKLPDSVEVCFINAVLNWKVKGDKYIVTGMFVGSDSKKNRCSEGTVSMEVQMSAGAIFKADPPPPAPDTTTTENIPPGDQDKITEGRNKHITWEAATATLEVWDAGVIDGDVVSVLVNDKMVLANYTLSAQKKLINIPLTEKVNTITVMAVSEGDNPPNTVQMVLTDGATQHKVTAFNKKGKAASIILTRK